MDPKLTLDPNISYGPAAPGRYYYRAGDRPLDGVTIKRAIGRGGFGEVYFAVTDAGKQLAVKHITRAVEVERRGAAHCINIKSHNLIQLYDFRTNAEGASFVLMEYVAGPSLKEVIEQHPKGLPDDQIRSHINGLVAGVAELHAAGIVHRDLKPANIFLEDGVVKVGDYGLSKTITEVDRDHSVSVGTCHYMAPEIRSGRYDKPIDTYAIGVILYELITGRPPFQGETVAEILMRHQFDRPDLAHIPAHYREILARTLDKDPAKRPGDVRQIARWLDTPPQAAKQKPSAAGPNGDAPNQPTPESQNLAERFAELLRGPNAQRLHRAKSMDAAATLNARQSRWSRPRVRPGEIVFEAPPWPSDQQRARSLVRSLIWTIACCWLLAAPVGFLSGVNMSDAPNRVAFVATVAALLTTAMLVLQFSWENWDVATRQKRLVGMAAGGLVGLSAAVLATWLGAEHRPEKMDQALPDLLNAYRIALGEGHMVSYALMGGLSLAIPRWWLMLERDRPSRWAMSGLVKWTLWGMVISPMAWSSNQPAQHVSLGFAILVVTGLAAQFTSPWDKALSDYRMLRRMAGKRNGRLF